MNKKFAAALSGGAVLIVALSGCTDDSAGKAKDWAKQVCDQAQPQVKKITDANTSIRQVATSDSSKPADVQQADSTAFQNISAAYRTLSSTANAAGVPPRDGGDQAHQDAVKQLTAASAAYTGLVKQIEALDTKDQAQFADGLKGVAGDLDKAGKMGDQALRTLLNQPGDLGKEMAKQPGCQKSGGAA